jgi:hypothetical protein
VLAQSDYRAREVDNRFHDDNRETAPQLGSTTSVRVGVLLPSYYSANSNFMTNRKDTNRTILDFPGEWMFRECSRETSDLLLAEGFQKEWRPNS